MTSPITVEMLDGDHPAHAMAERFFCAGCGEEISGEFCDEDGHGLCRGCDREQQMESAADRRADR